jgi:hypothetical protein
MAVNLFRFDLSGRSVDILDHGPQGYG